MGRPMAQDSTIDMEPLVAGATLAQDSLDFRYAGRATKALLVVTQGGKPTRFAAARSDDQGHAEANLLATGLWAAALADAAKAGPSDEMVIHVLISRAPCHAVLTDAAGRLLDPVETRRYSRIEAVRLSKTGGALRMLPGCTSRLIEAIRPFRENGGSSSGVRFVLACRGTYEPTAEGTRVGVGTTTTSDVKKLIAAGWDVRALCIGGNLSRFGGQLSQFLQSL